MSRVGIKKIAFKNYDEAIEAILWEDEETEELSVEVASPWEGFNSAKDLHKLGTALIDWSKRMQKAGQ